MSDGDKGRISIQLPEPIALPDGRGAAVTLPAGVFAPGSSFTTTVEVSYLDAKAQGIRVEFGYVNTHEEWARDSDGDRYRKTVRTWVPIAGQQLPAELGRYPVQFVIPPNAPPSVPQMVEWRIRAMLDRHHGFDQTFEIGVVLVTYRGMYDQQPLPPPIPAMGIPLWLELSGPLHLHRGETLRGTVVVQPRLSLNLRAIRLDLVRAIIDSCSTDEMTMATVPLTGPFRTEIGQQWSMPFSLFLPPRLVPTSHAWKSSLVWRLHIVADVPMGVDHVTRIPITLT